MVLHGGVQAIIIEVEALVEFITNTNLDIALKLSVSPTN